MHHQHRCSGEPMPGAGMDAESLAHGLGWFSIALGLAEVLAPRALTRGLGMEGSERLVQAYGLRELATGFGILGAEQPAPWIWGRVGGDVLDIATLASGFDDRNPKKPNVAFALLSVLGVTALDIVCAQQLSGGHKQQAQPLRDYSDRSGLPRPPQQMRGAARDFRIPRDFQTPEALRPFDQQRQRQARASAS